MIHSLLNVVDLIFNIFIFILIASAVFSWLYAFNIVNPRNPLVAAVGRFLYRVTEPVLRPIRRFLPSLGGMDLSPLVLFIIIYFIRDFMWNIYRTGSFF